MSWSHVLDLWAAWLHSPTFPLLALWCRGSSYTSFPTIWECYLTSSSFSLTVCRWNICTNFLLEKLNILYTYFILYSENAYQIARHIGWLCWIKTLGWLRSNSWVPALSSTRDDNFYRHGPRRCTQLYLWHCGVTPRTQEAWLDQWISTSTTRTPK